MGVHRSSSQLLLRQKRNWIIDSFTIDEGYQGPFPYQLGKVSDSLKDNANSKWRSIISNFIAAVSYVQFQIEIEKDFVLFKVHGQGVDMEPKNVLEINEYTGKITVLRPVDSEEYSVLKVR